jgi:hypothetical protein
MKGRDKGKGGRKRTEKRTRRTKIKMGKEGRHKRRKALKTRRRKKGRRQEGKEVLDGRTQGVVGEMNGVRKEDGS